MIPSRPVSAWRRVRASEWVVAGYLAFAALRMASLGLWDIKARQFARDDLLVAFLWVGVVKLAVETARTPWPDPTRPAARFAKLLAPAFLLPSLLVLASRPDLFPRAPDEGGTFVPMLLTAHAAIRSGSLVVCPPLVLALATGLHLKSHGELETVVLFREGLVVLLREAREWFPALALLYAYGLLARVQEHPFFLDQDATLAAIDRHLFFGRDPLDLLQGVVSRPLSEWLSACYTFYLPLFPLVLGWIYSKPGRLPFRETVFALTTVLAVGYALYVVVPAKGPLFVKRFDVSLDLYYVGWLKEQLMDKTRVPRDCFPSLHTAASLVLLWATFRHARRLFYVLAPVVLSIPLACVYLRYHYVVDVLAGIALVACVATLTKRLSARGAFDDSSDVAQP